MKLLQYYNRYMDLVIKEHFMLQTKNKFYIKTGAKTRCPVK